MIRLNRFDLDLFGRFSGHSFDFGDRPADGPDFHIIHGANEAGKTTTMEGFLRLFYGFPLRESYDFRHERKTLQVSGTLDFGTETRRLTRLTSRRDNLVDETGAPQPEMLLTSQLGGLDMDQYRKLLCLDDATIETGGEEIANAKGNMGQILFSAASGIENLGEVLDGLRLRADEIWKKAGSKNRIASLKRDLKEIEERIRDEDISANAYRKLRQSLEAARAHKAGIAAERQECLKRLHEAKALRDALPLLAKIDRLDMALEGTETYPETLPADPEHLVILQSRRQRAEGDLDRLAREIAEVEESLATLDRHPEDLGLAALLERLDGPRSRYTTAVADLPNRRRTLEGIEQDMREAARDLRSEADPTALVLSEVDLAALEETQDAMIEARRSARAEDAELESAAEALFRAAEDLKEAAPESDTDLGALLARHGADTLATAHAGAMSALATARARTAETLSALTHGTARFDVLPACPIAPEDAEEKAARHAKLSLQIETAESTLREIDTEAADLSREIAGMSTGGLPADAEAAKTRARRDSLWQDHLSAMTPATAAPFEAAMREVDSMGDSRLARASDLGRLRQMEQDHARLKVRLTRVSSDLDRLRGEAGEIETALSEAAEVAGLIDPLTPSAFAAWTRRLEEARRAEASLAHLTREHAPLVERAEALRKALSPHIDLAAPDFDSLLTEARRRAEEARKSREKIAALKATHERLEKDHARRRVRHEAACEAEAQTEAHWRSHTAALLGEAVAPDILAASLAPLRRLRERDEARRDVQRRIDRMEEDRNAFTAEVESAAGQTGDPLALHAALAARAETARKAEARHADLTETLEKKQETLAEAQRSLDAIDAEAAAIAGAFPAGSDTATLADLREATARAGRVIDERRARAEAVLDLCLRLDCAHMEAARARLGGVSMTEIDARIADIETEQTDIDTRWQDAIARHTTAANSLDAVTADAEIAALTERRTTLELELLEAAREHLRLGIGHTLAEEALRRYRDAHRGPMLRAAETAFADLTNGAYRRLTTQPENGSETLIAITDTGESKRADAMSKGTRFQLYLALRAAAYEQLAGSGTVLPFFCDDIFETFDEARTRAACALMARIGRTGQAIYLTHHAHVVEIAREVCGSGVRVHDL